MRSQKTCLSIHLFGNIANNLEKCINSVGLIHNNLDDRASTIVSTGIYIVIGLFGGWAFQYSGSQDLLDALTQETTGGWQIVSQVRQSN